MLSRKRDGFTPAAGRSLDKWEDLVAFINELNHTWLAATRRLSTQVLCDLLAHTGPQAEAYFASLDPFALGDSVSWAGAGPAPVWLDIAPERWHHQQQMRDATGRPGLYAPHLFAPVLEAFMRALPQTFREIPAAESTTVQLQLEGAAAGAWCVRKASNGWELLEGEIKNPTAEVTIKAEDAWKIFTRGLTSQQARDRASIRGDKALGAKLLETVSVIA